MSMLLQNTTNFFIRAAKKIDAILYPNMCPSCNVLLDSQANWCSACLISFMHAINQRYCPKCASSLGPHQEYSVSSGKCSFCEKLQLPLNNVCRLGVYEQSLSRAIVNFKYRSDMFGLDILARMLSDRLSEQNWFKETDILCPIPSHWKRKFKRGFNQSAVLAERISSVTSKPMILLLRKTRETLSQTGLNLSQRKENVQGAFAVRSSWDVTLSNVCLIDDVMTTGATLAEASRVLKEAGAKRVSAGILARAEYILQYGRRT